MRIVDYLDKGASLGPNRACLTTEGRSLSYADVVDTSYAVAAALAGSGVAAGDKVAIISSNDPVAFSCVFGISRAGAVWCPINPRNEAAENRELLALFDCATVIFKSSYADLVARIRDDLPAVRTWVCFDAQVEGALTWDAFLALGEGASRVDRAAVDDLAMIAGTGGTTGRPKGVMLSGRNLRDDVGADVDGLPLRRAPGLSGASTADARRGSAVFPGARAWRRDRHHASTGCR